MKILQRFRITWILSVETFFIFLDKLNHMYVFPSFSVNVISPAYRYDQCIAGLVSFLEGRYFSMRVLLFKQMQVNPCFEDTLLPHSLAWSDETLLVTVRRRSEGQPRSQNPVHPPRLAARTDTLSPHDREKSSLPWMQLHLGSCMFSWYFSCSFASSSSLGFVWAFPGTRARFFISTAPSSAAPKSPKPVRCLMQCCLSIA